MGATNALHFGCKCLRLAGAVENASSREGDYVVCHCHDCQAWARLLGADHVLDEHGGTALYQSRCARLRIDRGSDHLACAHLTKKPTLRWYADCCDTPLFNTYANGRIPYVTTLLANCDDASPVLLGKPLGHLFLADAKGDASHLKPLSMSKLMRRFAVRMAKDIFSGDRRRNPLFDPETLDPIAPPRRITAEERATLPPPS